MALLCRASKVLSCARFARSYGQCTTPTILMLQRAAVSPKRLYSSERDTKEVVPSQPSVGSVSEHSGQNSTASGFGISSTNKVTTLQKYILVWQGAYKSVAEVPDMISQSKLEGVMNRARIKINLMSIAATVLGCILMIILGKKAQKEGVSVSKMNQDWHRKMKEEGK